MKPLLSICMMVKNEEKNLERCLRSVQPIMQAIPTELIVVDTGSSDGTVEIAKQFTDKLFVHMWNNNFAEMRNITISYAQGKWVLILDADEELESSATVVSFLKACQDKRIGSATLLVKNITNGLSGQYTTMVSARLFRRNKQFFYRGAVHNEPVFQGGIAHLDDSLVHYGYISDDEELMQRKFERTSTLLKTELAKDPDNVYYRYQLSVSYSMHGEWLEALAEIWKIYERYQKEDDVFWRRHLYVIGGVLQACVVNRRSEEEVIQFALRGIRLEPEYVDLYFYIAQLYELQGKPEEAYEYYRQHGELVRDFPKLKINSNMALMHYTLSMLTADYYYMGIISYRKGDFVQTRQHLEQVLEIAAEDDLFVNQARSILVGIDFVDKDYTDSRKIYETLLEKNLQEQLEKIEMEIEKLLQGLQREEKQQFYRQFCDLPNLYGKLNFLRLYNGDIGEAEWQFLIEMIVSLNLNILPDYYALVLAYSLKFRPQDAWKISAVLSEQTIVGYMSYMDEVDKVMFVKFCRDYVTLDDDNSASRFQIDRLRKNIAKYLLFSGELDDAEYLETFKLYIKWGQSFIELLYREAVFENELIFDLKNKEEMFLLYMTLAHRNNDQNRYMRYLRKALKVYPEMNRGIEGLANTLSNQTRCKEMETLTLQLLASLDDLIESEQFDAALGLIEECKNIIGHDLRLLAIQSDILKKRYQ
ncbi:glycosyltransferase [Desulfosporosinus sp. PR]|uniref:tetratricopeptide repeat-containing glycosyltransferase family 2 protein n=1 Tax=Candidatus Desulfosporosinus nitrosoreducens TaxID=3401928 RepID=UPI0027FE51EC|nr:glycosyltransferase [Desulfosporosinus sp. PR]MDQ7096257.1 glycosyltransferase [Desulfosporosinus sp. PR]